MVKQAKKKLNLESKKYEHKESVNGEKKIDIGSR